MHDRQAVAALVEAQVVVATTVMLEVRSMVLPLAMEAAVGRGGAWPMADNAACGKSKILGST